MKITSLILVFTMLFVTTPFALAVSTNYEVEMLVSQGKKTKETDSVIFFKEESFSVIPDKSEFKKDGKEFNFADIKAADYSYAKKPLLSTGGAITTVVLLGLIGVPFLFMKKKMHWLTVRTEDNFAVIKLQKSNYRQILAEFETKNIEVKTVNEEENKDKKEKKETNEN